MKSASEIIAWGILLTCLATRANAAEYFVTPDNVNSVIAASRAGDIITFRNGVYNNVAIDFKPSQHGSAENPITLRAETQGGVVFRGDGTRLRINRNWLVVDGFVWEDVRVNGSNDYVIRFNHVDDTVFKNNVLRNVYNDNLDAAAIRIASASDRNILERNEFTAIDHSKSYRMVQVYAFSNSTPPIGNVIRYNHFHDMTRAIQLGQGSNSNPPDPYLDTVVEGNLFENMEGYTVHIKTSGNLLKNNTVRNARSAADVRTGRDNDYIGNYFFDALPIKLLYGAGEVRDNYMERGYNSTDRGEAINLGWGDVPYPQTSQANPAKDYLIANNTIIDFDDAGIDFDLRRGVSGHTLPPEDNAFERNLIWNTAGKAIDTKGANNQTWEANVVWSTGSGVPGHTPSGVIVADPGLAQNEHGLWYSTLYPEVGADVSRRPLTALDVGPGSTFSYDALLWGDYNDDGAVDAIDYSVWRESLGNSTVLPNDSTPGAVDSSDFALWRSNYVGPSFNQSLHPSRVAAPEPTAMVLGLLAVATSPNKVRRFIP